MDLNPLVLRFDLDIRSTFYIHRLDRLFRRLTSFGFPGSNSFIRPIITRHSLRIHVSLLFSSPSSPEYPSKSNPVHCTASFGGRLERLICPFEVLLHLYFKSFWCDFGGFEGVRCGITHAIQISFQVDIRKIQKCFAVLGVIRRVVFNSWMAASQSSSFTGDCFAPFRLIGAMNEQFDAGVG